jgi:hypothetical protein
MRLNLYGGISLFGSLLSVAVLIPGEAHAGLIGPGTTVQAFFYNGVFANPAGLIPDGASTSNPIALTAPVDFTNNVSEVNINVGDTQIVMTNTAPGAPFCLSGNVGTACADVIDGFDFKFTGENILGVSVDPSSAVNFLPVTGTFQGNTHLGLVLLSNNEIQVDVTGDLPLVNDMLILDLSFTSTPPSPTPLPATLPLFAAGLGAMGLFGWRKRRQGSATVAA